MNSKRKPRLLLVSIVPPQNDCGVRIVMHRHLVERSPFELHVATNTPEAWNPDLNVTLLDLPYPLQRVRKSRFGPKLGRWFTVYENLILPLTRHSGLDRCIKEFKPDVILTLAETGLSHLAARSAKNHGIPLAGLFLDWFPIMDAHYGHKMFQPFLNSRFRQIYKECDLALCTSEGMQDILGSHPNSHVVYPMGGNHSPPPQRRNPSDKKFRLVYVGTAEGFYGRMLLELANCLDDPNMELRIIGPNSSWTAKSKRDLTERGIYLGPMPPERAASELSDADALLVVMSFEKQYEMFMKTSFTTKFLDYTAFGKPVVLWGPSYCTPSQLAVREDAAIVINDPNCQPLIGALERLQANDELYKKYATAAMRLRETLFHPGRLQDIFVTEISRLVQSQ